MIELASIVSNPAERISDALDGTKSVLIEVGKCRADNPRLKWLEAQLRNIEKQLQNLLLDLEAGVLFKNLGFFSDSEFDEMFDDLEVEITNLRGLIQTQLSLDR